MLKTKIKNREKTGNTPVSVPLEITGNTGNTGNACPAAGLSGVPEWAKDAVMRAAELSQAARAAALAGDHNQAGELRAEFDRIYDELEARALDLAALASDPPALILPAALVRVST